ncbi:apolipoprotein acyltransferase [Sulfitobacter sabulilitoris]|uniref:Apolipoprotein acyltransferase n=1 Tax=Sulfitobacter sabulilitoris TaxID=2562655 RepID=A0A5S3PJ59_9RHOB|nr:apolipoprotein acyltransferase [Sulfitobacter sabulilitoris]TMM54438.1 apolipoprotein acyltransferase [Sulfitobacter sabulilitoris]
MIVLAAALLGAIIGGITAYRRKGNGKDIAQYATGYAIAFVLVGMIATIVIHRLAL